MDENWQQARLIPTSGINGPEEAERRATSALLAVLGAVREFSIALTKPFGAPAAQLETYIEVPFKLGDAKVIPDGLLRASRGSKQWTALVEVKTGTNELGREQIEQYLDVARENNFDAVITISNQISPAPGVHPTDVDKRKLRKVALVHVSWAEVLTLAVQQRVHRGVADPDQAWILAELIRYLEHPKSGALDFSDMGQDWVTTRESVAAGTLRATDKGLNNVVARWDQLLRYAALRLGRELGADVQLAVSRKESADPALRHSAMCATLAANGCLTGSIRIPDAVGTLDVVADVRAGRVTVSMDIEGPGEGRNATRVTWLTRQLKNAPGDVRIDAWALNQRDSASELLSRVREEPLCLAADPKKDLKRFRVAMVLPLGAKRSSGRGSFIDSVINAVETFYREIAQQLRPWSARAPQLPPDRATALEAAGINVAPPPSEVPAAQGESESEAGDAAPASRVTGGVS